MRHLLIILVSALTLSACADHSAPMASGDWRVLNAGQWDIDPHLITVPELPKVTESDKS